MQINLLANPALMQFVLGLLLGLLLSAVSYRLGALSRSGAAAAAVTGGLVFGLGGWDWAALLLAFFISSSGLSKTFAQRKAGLSEKFSKGHRRDWAQVAANGGLGAVLAVAHSGLPDAAWPWLAFAGAMAAVNADTWATELGVLNRRLPRLITNWKPVERGASGAVSPLGSLAALGGAALVGIIAALLSEAQPGETLDTIRLLLAVITGGLAGSFADSLLGATLQSIYWCPRCGKETERYPHHSCGSETQPYRGWRWMDNDRVNFLASFVGAAVTLLLI